MGNLGSLKYSEYNKLRKEFMVDHAFWKVPHIHEHPYKTTARIIEENANPRVLDFGANDRNLYNFLNEEKITCQYESFDTDESMHHEYYNIDDIKKKFDLVTLFAVVEHIPPEQLIDDVLPKLFNIMNKDAKLIIYTNNIYHPLGIRMDLDHEIGYGLRELYAVCASQGLKLISAHRHGGVRRPFKWFYELLIRTVLSPFKIDYATSIVMIFQKR